MNNFIKQVIEEKFASKAQQRYFYSQAGKGGKKGKKWAKWAKEFSDKTDFENIPDKVEEKELDEIVDENGNIKTDKKPTNFNAKGITQKKTSDEVVKSAGGSMGTHGVHGTHTTLKYWAEGKDSLKNLIENFIDEIEMDGALGYDETLGDDASYEEAESYFKSELGLSDEETKLRLQNLGYDEKLKGDKVRLVEKNKKYFEEFIESIISKRNVDNDIVKNKSIQIDELNPIIKRQINSLKDTLESNNLKIEDVLEFLKNHE